MNSRYSCIIVDDEQDAIDLLTDRLQQLHSNVDVIATYTHWADALNDMRVNKYDLLFLDVSMPGKSGLELLSLLPAMETEVIFVTAYDTYAIKAFSLAASGYILKPVDDLELSATVTRAIERVKNRELANQTRNSGSRASDRIGVPNNHGIDYVNIDDILYLESVNKCTQIVTTAEKYLSSNNIGTYKNLVDDYSFFQIHRSFIVNVKRILRYESVGVVIMEDKTEIPLSRNVKNEFLNLLNSK